MDGKLVNTLVEESQQSGIYTVYLEVGKLPSGVYYASLQAGEHIETVSLVVCR